MTRRPVDINQDNSWRVHAHCRGVDPDLFYPERGEPAREAKAVCAGCVVREHCLEHALVTVEQRGIWGGMSERQRRRLRRARNQARRQQHAGADARREVA